MTLEERVTRLEAIVEMVLAQLERLVGFELHILYMFIGGISAIAFLVIKNKKE